NKWFTRLAVAAAVVHTIAGLKLHYPVVGAAARRELAAARARLTGE
ncbi:MAG: polyphosphate kinase 2 family protein, partial [Proteobacteria bacterium]